MELSESKWKLSGPCHTQESKKATLSPCKSKLSSVSESKICTIPMSKQPSCSKTQDTIHNGVFVEIKYQISNLKYQISNTKVARKGGAPASNGSRRRRLVCRSDRAGWARVGLQLTPHQTQPIDDQHRQQQQRQPLFFMAFHADETPL